MGTAARIFLVAGALVLAAGVTMGAVGSHAARTAAHPDAARLVQTAVLYQLVHGIGLVLAGVMARSATSRWLLAAGGAFGVGIACFCGSLYWLAFTGSPAGAIAPLGGTAFIAGWILFAIHALAADRR